MLRGEQAELQILLDMRKHFLVRELRKPWDQWGALRGLNAAGKSITDFWCLGKPQGKKF